LLIHIFIHPFQLSIIGSGFRLDPLWISADDTVQISYLNQPQVISCPGSHRTRLVAIGSNYRIARANILPTSKGKLKGWIHLLITVD